MKQIAESTKISVRSLEAIERGEFTKLPGGIYSTSYIRQYARAIDYDETILIKIYQREMAETETLPAKDTGKGRIGSFRPASSILGL